MSIISSIRNIIARNVMPRVFLNWSDTDILLRKRKEKEEIRQKEGRPHEVFYFYELSDPYSHITAQLISNFKAEYAIDLTPLVVGEPPSKTVHEPTMYRKYCLTDAIRIAPFYGIEFPINQFPNDKVISLAQRILCDLERDEFISRIAEISTFVWSDNEAALKA